MYRYPLSSLIIKYLLYELGQYKNRLDFSHLRFTMSKREIIATLRSEKPYLRQHFGVEEIGVFGSHARGEEMETAI
jgi:hypothetical protein